MKRPAITQTLDQSVNQLLQEIRIVLPGTQALLGFQLMAVFQQIFHDLPELIRYAHVFSLGFTCIATILLMSPASFDGVAEKKQITEKFYIFSSKMLLLALVFLGFGIAGDIYVVTHIVSNNYVLSGVTSGIILLTSFILWFGYPLSKSN